MNQGFTTTQQLPEQLQQHLVNRRPSDTHQRLAQHQQHPIQSQKHTGKRRQCAPQFVVRLSVTGASSPQTNRFPDRRKHTRTTLWYASIHRPNTEKEHHEVAHEPRSTHFKLIPLQGVAHETARRLNVQGGTARMRKCAKSVLSSRLFGAAPHLTNIQAANRNSRPHRADCWRFPDKNN